MPDQNVQAITNGHMQAIANENTTNVLNIIFIDETVNDFEVDSGYGSGNSSINGSDNSSINESDNSSVHGSDNSSINGSDNSNVNGSDTDSNYQVEFIINDPSRFIMPDVDFNVCSIHECREFEFKSLYAKELEEHNISDEQLTEIVSWFTAEQLATNMVNDVFIDVITRL